MVIFQIIFSITINNISEDLNMASPWNNKGWSHNSPQLKKYEALVIFLTSYFFSKKFKSGFSMIFLPLAILLVLILFDINPKFSNTNEDNIPIFVTTWCLLQFIQTSYQILTINLVCRYFYDTKFKLLTLLWTLSSLINSIQISSSDNSFYKINEVSLVRRDEITVLGQIFFYASTFYSVCLLLLADPDDGLLIDGFGLEIFKSSGEKNLE